MGRIADWWLNRKVDADWSMPISNVQGFRPVGGFLIGSAGTIEFVPNRFEAMIGGTAWTASVNNVRSVTLGRRRLRIEVQDAAGSTRTLFTNRPKAVRRHLAGLLQPS
jgi:hypothetical protein